MCAAIIIDGKALADEVRAGLKQDVKGLIEQGIEPGLAVVLVGDDPASAIYVRNKTRACNKTDIRHFDYNLPALTTQDELLELVDKLNHDSNVDGILVQLPLPKHIDADTVIQAIDPKKDVDGFHPFSIGRLVTGDPTFVSCTPLGVLHMLKSVNAPLEGANALVVGRSNIVGKPMAQLLLAQNCTVTVAHSRTRNLSEIVGQADILVAAVGKPEIIKGAWIKKGAIVIDVGTNRVNDKWVGDVEFAAACERARAISPVPGGVGPMTIAMLLANTVRAAARRNGWAAK